MGAFGVGARPGEFVLAFFGEPSAERVVGVTAVEYGTTKAV